MFFFNSAAF